MLAKRYCVMAKTTLAVASRSRRHVPERECVTERWVNSLLLAVRRPLADASRHRRYDTLVSTNSITVPQGGFARSGKQQMGCMRPGGAALWLVAGDARAGAYAHRPASKALIISARRVTPEAIRRSDSAV